jgi:hypothetical protein
VLYTLIVEKTMSQQNEFGANNALILAADAIRQAKHMVVFTGAGMAKDSGKTRINTYYFFFEHFLFYKLILSCQSNHDIF